MKVEKNSAGFWIVETKEAPLHPSITKWYTKYKFRDQPEVVKGVLDFWPELKDHINYDYYDRWCKSLQGSDKIKNSNSDFKFWGHNFKVDPFSHQKRALRFLMSVPCAGLFMEPGTGKTLTTLLSIELRHKLGLSKKTLILCPASIVYTSWYKDAVNLTNLPTPHIIRSKKLRWFDPKTKTMARKWREGRPEFLKQNDHSTIEDRLNSDDEVFICSIDLFSANVETFKRFNFDTVVLDESTMVKNPSSKRLKNVIEVSRDSKYRIALTGTPLTGSIEDLWSQMKFIDNSIADTIGSFRSEFMREHPAIPHVFIEKRGSRDRILDMIENRVIFIKKEDCLDLPERLSLAREVEMPALIKKHFKEFYKDSLTVIKDDTVQADNPLTRLLRLQQIANGYCTNKDGEMIYIEQSNKLREVKSIIEQLPETEKIIIWANFREDFKALEKTLKQYNPIVINGLTKDKDAADCLFAESKDHRILIAHPKSVKFGKTWNAAKTTIFYSYSASLEDYLQARDRNYRIGQNSKVTEYFLICSTVEEMIYESLQNKQQIAIEVADFLRIDIG